MRKLMVLTGLVASGALLVACSNDNGRSVVDKAEDKVAEGVGQVSASAWGSNNAQTYVTSAAAGDLYEIRSADLALQHSSHDGVKELARMIKADHTAATEQLKTAVGEQGVSVAAATDLDERRKGMLDNLASAAKSDFDRVYLQQQVAAHEEALILHRGFADNADAPELSAHARAVVPKIEAHLKMARDLLVTLTAS